MEPPFDNGTGTLADGVTEDCSVVQNSQEATISTIEYFEEYELSSDWDRYSVTGLFDMGTQFEFPFTFSVYLKGGVDSRATLVLDGETGYLRCSLKLSGDMPIYVWGAQLELSNAPTTYIPRTV